MQGFSVKTLKHLVLDEADRLLNMDFEQEIDQILKVCSSLSHAGCCKVTVQAPGLHLTGAHWIPALPTACLHHIYAYPAMRAELSGKHAKAPEPYANIYCNQ